MRVAAILLPATVSALAALTGTTVAPLKGGAPVDVGALLAAPTKQCVIFGTYAADFNAIEYAQRARHYLPKMRAKGVDGVSLILNAEPAAAAKACELLGVDADEISVFCDPTGAAGRAFGCSRGWLPDEDALFDSIPLNAYGKLFGMLLGLGAWATLPAVIGGYIGNPFRGQPWIEDAIAQGATAGRWPGKDLVVDLDASGAVSRNAFAELPVVGEWPRRPLELATLRLQNMVGVSLAHWDELKPADEHDNVLTQLGGIVVSDGAGGTAYEYRDPGICAVCNFEDLLEAL